MFGVGVFSVGPTEGRFFTTGIWGHTGRWYEACSNIISPFLIQSIRHFHRISSCVRSRFLEGKMAQTRQEQLYTHAAAPRPVQQRQVQYR